MTRAGCLLDLVVLSALVILLAIVLGAAWRVNESDKRQCERIGRVWSDESRICY